jgi:hypothetical protein
MVLPVVTRGITDPSAILMTTIASLIIANTAQAEYGGDHHNGNIAPDLPDPTDEQATEAFNDLQDHYGRPHADRVTYSPRDNCYHWIGPKYHKRMKMSRDDFNMEVWYLYYLKTRQSSKPETQEGLTDAAGPQPDDIDFHVYGSDAIKKELNDPDSYVYERCGDKTMVTTYEGERCWVTRVFFRAKNALNANIKSSALVFLTKNGDETKVLGVKIDEGD